MAKKKKTVGKDVKDIANTVWLAGLGALATTQEEGGKLFRKLVKKGEKFEKSSPLGIKDQVEKAKDQVGKAREQVQEGVEKAKGALGGAFGDVASTLDEQLGRALHRLGVPTRDEIKNLTQRVEALMAKVDQRKPAAKSAAKPAARKPAAAKASPRKAASKAPAKPAVKPAAASATETTGTKS
jgi:poly(hydroxyalkanoate) granule-associated protein